MFSKAPREDADFYGYRLGMEFTTRRDDFVVENLFPMNNLRSLGETSGSIGIYPIVLPGL